MAVDPFDPYKGIRDAIEKMNAPLRAAEASRKMVDDMKRASQIASKPAIDPHIIRRATQPLIDAERIRRIAQPVPIDIAASRWLENLKQDVAGTAARAVKDRMEALRSAPLIDFTTRDRAMEIIAGAGAVKFDATAAALEQIAALTERATATPHIDVAKLPLMTDLVSETLAAVNGDHARFAGALSIAAQNRQQLKLIRESMRLSDVRELLRDLEIADDDLDAAVAAVSAPSDPEELGKLLAFLLEQIDGVKSYYGEKREDFDQRVLVIKLWILIRLIASLISIAALSIVVVNYTAGELGEAANAVEKALVEKSAERLQPGQANVAPPSETNDQMAAVENAGSAATDDNAIALAAELAMRLSATMEDPNPVKSAADIAAQTPADETREI